MSETAPTALLDNSNKEDARSRATMSRYELSVAVGILLCSRLAGSTRQSLWFDEGYTLALANSASFRQFMHTFASFTTSEHLQPLYYVCMFLFSRLAGASDFALRLPSAIFSTLSGLLVFSLAHTMGDSFHRAMRWFPHAALAAYCLASFSYYYAQEARPYALIQLVSLCIVYYWVRLHRSNSSYTNDARCFLLTCVAGVLTSPFVALVIVSLALSDLLLNAQGWSRLWKRPIIATAAVYIGYLLVARSLMPWLISHDIVAIRQPIWMNAAYTLFGVIFGTTLGPPSIMLHHAQKLNLISAYWRIALTAACSLVALGVAAIRILRRTNGSSVWMRVLMLATIFHLLGLFLVFGVIGRLNVLPRHASGVFAMLFVLCMALASRLRSPLQYSSALFVAGLVGVFALNGLSQWQYCTNPLYRKDDYRAMANVIRLSASSSNTPVFLVEGDPELFRHYGVALIDASQVDPEHLTRFIRKETEADQTFDLVVNNYRNFRWNTTATPAQILEPSYQCSILQSLSYMQLQQCSPTSSRLQQAGLRSPRPVGGSSVAR